MNQCNKAASQRSNRSLFVQQSLVNTGIHYKASQTPQHGRYLPSQMLTCNLLKAASRRHVGYAVKLQTDLLFAA